MTPEQFNDLVYKLEQQAIRNPKSYQRKVLMLGLLGNVYIGAILLLLAGLLIALVLSAATLKVFAVKGLLVVGAFSWMVLKALWVQLPPPAGKRITRQDAPELFAIIDNLGRQLRAPQFHEVLLIDEFNAAVVQVPRLGIFGFYRNYLLIGLPLMKSLSKAQFTAVLAHEFGHLAEGHGRAANWIYRLRLRWARLIDMLNANQSRGSFLFKHFFNWYAPYFNTYSFPLARATEYQADAASVRLTSRETVAQALTNVKVVGSYLSEKYWPEIHKQVITNPVPNFMPYTELNAARLRELDGETTDAWIASALNRKTDASDTHPSLSERLNAIQAPAQLAPPVPGDTACNLLGAQLDEFSREFDLRWQDQIGYGWKKRHDEIQKEKLRLTALEEKKNTDTGLTLDEQFERAFLTESVLDDQDSAFEQLRELYETNKDNARACFCYAARLLDRKQSEGYALMQESYRLEKGYTLHAYRLLRDYCTRTQQNDLAQEWDQLLVAGYSKQQESERERGHITLKDKFEKHGLPDSVINTLREQLRGVPEIRRVYLLRKAVKHYPEHPCYLLGFATTPWYWFFNDRKRQRALSFIQENITLPDGTVIFHVDGKNYKFNRKFWRRTGFRIL